DLPLVNPVGEMAQEVVAEKSMVDYVKVGTKVGLKYLTAIAAAYMTYKAFKSKDQGNSNIFAKMSAFAAFVATKKLIDRSNRPDLRYWVSLPQHLYLNQLKISPGTYDLVLTISYNDQSSSRF